MTKIANATLAKPFIFQPALLEPTSHAVQPL